MIHYHVKKPPLWKTLGTVMCICLIGLFVCVYLLFSGIKAHEEQFKQTETELKQTQLQLQITKQERAKLQHQITILENLEYERGTMTPPVEKR